MKSHLSRYAWFCLIIFVVSSLPQQRGAASAEDLLVGAAKRIITPAVGEDKPPVWIAGFGDNRRATGVHDDLFARAIVFKSGDTGVAFVALDLIGLFHDETLKIREEVTSRRSELGVSHVVVAATHNHEGPDTIGLWGPNERTTGVNPSYLSSVRKQAVLSIVEAAKNARPAALKVGKAQVKGLVDDGRKPVVIDDTLYAMKAEDRGTGDAICTLINYSNHPESLGSKNTLITADYPKYLIDKFESEVGGEVVFINGSVGGMMSPLGIELTDPKTGRPAKRGSFRNAQLIGERVAAAAVSAVASAEPMDVKGISFKVKEVFVPMTNKRFKMAAGVGLFRRDLYTNGKIDKGVTEVRVGEGATIHAPTGRDALTEVNVINIADAQFITIPGEIYPEITIGGIQTPQDPGADFQGAPKEPALRSLMKGKYKFVLGLANDELGYIIPKSEWDEKPPYTYGSNRAPYGEVNSAGYEMAPIIAGAIRELLTGG